MRLGVGEEPGAGLPGEGRDACVHGDECVVVVGESGDGVVLDDGGLDVVVLVEEETGFFVCGVLGEAGAASGLKGFEAKVEAVEGCCDDECDE